MNTQSQDGGPIRTRADVVPGPAANDASRVPPRDGRVDDLPLAETITQLPGVQLVYRALKSWQEQFAPRHYNHGITPLEELEPLPRDSGPG